MIPKKKACLFVLTLAALTICILGSLAGQDPNPQNPALNMMPLPAKISFNQGKLRIDAAFCIGMSGYNEPRLLKGAERLIKRMTLLTGIPFPMTPEKDASQAVLEIRCAGAGQKVQSLTEDESYALTVIPTRALLEAKTAVGVLRGIETFLQLIALDGESFYVPALKIQDAPRFPWRGLMIDVCRHWLPVEVIKRNLEAMAVVKLNVFHWHLSEDQGFRVESRIFPRLQQFGSDGNYFTQAEIRDVINYARDLGIRVIPEFDMPGHSTAWFVGYPELASAPGPYEIERHWGIFDPTMDPTRKEVYRFLDKFIGEMAGLFPDEYFHIGGDEVSGVQWDKSEAIAAFKKTNGLNTNADLQAYFTLKIQAILKKHGKKMIGWDEIFNPDLPKDIIIHSWRGQYSLADAARQGYMGILSAGYYLDFMLPAAEHYQVDPMEKEMANLTDTQRAKVLGGEACMWAEFLNPETVDSRLWPRMAAIAERFWSPQETKDVNDMYRRLDVVSRGIEIVGATHRSNYEKMLQRLAGNHPADALKILADIVEPLHEYLRPDTREYTQMTPLNRLVDASRPESDTGREFMDLVDGLLADGPSYAANRERIIDRLNLWRSNQERLKPVLDGSCLLKETIPLSEKVAAIAEAGLKAINYLLNDQAVLAGWLEENMLLLKLPEKPEYEVDIVIAPAVQKLVEAAARKKS